MSRILVLLAAAPVLFAQCEPALAVREVLEKAVAETAGRPYTESRRLRHGTYQKALQQHPHDYFLLRAALRATDDEKEALEWARAQREKHPDLPVHALIYARALEGRDTPESIRMIETILAGHPDFAQAHLALAEIRRWGKFKDDARAKRHLEAFFQTCPAPLDAAPLRTLSLAGTSEQMAAVAAAVRRRITQTEPHLMADVYEALWNLEFRATPPAEHDALRSRILEDLARLEQVPGRDSLRWLRVLQGGYRVAGNLERTERITQEILDLHPKSETAKSELRERWTKAHPYPAGKGKAEQAAWAREAAQQFEQWHRIWPEDSLLYSEWFSAMLSIPETPAEVIGRMGMRLVQLYNADPTWYSFPPVGYRVANAFLKNGVNVALVPDLVEKATVLAERRDRATLADDRVPDDFRQRVLEGMEGRRIERARVLLTYCAKTNDLDQARTIESDLAAITPAEERTKAGLLEVRAQAAEVLGRKLDALFLYRAALAARSKAPSAEDPLKENIERLWKELGGTSAAYALLFDKAKVSEAAGLRWEQPKKPLPPFRVPDLNGTTWTLDALKGKVVLINLWATWCGPCRAEHPAFQKLFDELKARPDVSVISFNIDDHAGQVAPYMKENKYTFPVLLARELVEQVLDTIAIPQNWFLNRNGKLEAVQVGYGGEAGWREQILAKLEEIAKAQ